MKYDERIQGILFNVSKGKILVLKGYSNFLKQKTIIKCKKYKNRFYMQFLVKSENWERYQKKEDIERDINGCLKRGDLISWETI